MGEQMIRSLLIALLLPGVALAANYSEGSKC
jgi:hypothetical protein